MSCGYGKTISQERLLKEPSTREFFDIFKFLVLQLDDQLEIDGKIEEEVPVIMRRLKYPVEVNRSKLQAISGPNTWPQLLAVLDWLVMLIQLTEELIEPVATCHPDMPNSDQEGGDQQLLRSLHENYLEYLRGKDSRADEERLRNIYEERIAALRAEIERLREQHTATEQQLHEYRSEHERLLELQKAPAQLELEADRLRGDIQSQESRVQILEQEIALAEAEEQERAQELERHQAMIRELTEQVEGQPFSKKDIERLKSKRSQLSQVLHELRADVEKVDQEVWDLGMQESNRVEATSRLVRQTNEAAESLENTLAGDAGPILQDLRVRVDLTELSDTFEAQDLDGLRDTLQSISGKHKDAGQLEEITVQKLLEEQRVVQEELSESERQCRQGKVRLEQLTRQREEYEAWSAAQLEEAQRTTEAAEDGVHAVSIGSAAPTLRDVAEIDKLRLVLNELQTQGANERAQLRQQIQREGEQFEESRRLVLGELKSYVTMTEALCQDVKAIVTEDEGGAHASSPCKMKVAQRGGC